MDVNSAADRMKCLINRLLNQMVVPFLGAGVSLNAIHQDDLEELCKTNKMCAKIEKAIDELVASKEYNNNELATWYHTQNQKGNPIKESLSKLSEVYLWLKGYDSENELVKLLEIEKFAGLKPLTAHRYVAFLAREGLINEVITTNYDTCLEKAYSNTFGWDEEKIIGQGSPASVIHNLDTFRANAGRTTFTSKGKQGNFLKIYKINGCAEACKNGAMPRTILLTEAQLQDWRERQWARDLFRDRLRSRSFVFSGFGSEEPQIRHTAIQVMEEYGENITGEINEFDDKNSSSNCWDLPNAPFIAEYEPELSYYPMQILQTYARAHCHNDNKEMNSNAWNAFTGKQSQYFSFTEAGKLMADDFWMRVYQLAFWQLLRTYCQHNSPVSSYLSELVPGAWILLKEMCDWLEPADEMEHRFGRYRQMLEFERDNNQSSYVKGVIPLDKWLWNSHGNKAPIPDGHYYPLMENSLEIPLFFLLVYLVLGDKAKGYSWKNLNDFIIAGDGILGLRFNHEVDEEEISIGLLISYHDGIMKNQAEVILPEELRYEPLIQIVIDDRQTLTSQHIRIRVPCSGEAENTTCYKYLSVHQLPLGSLLLYRKRLSNNLEETRKMFVRSLLDASLIVQQEKPHLRDRVKLLKNGG